MLLDMLPVVVCIFFNIILVYDICRPVVIVAACTRARMQFLYCGQFRREKKKNKQQNVASVSVVFRVIIIAIRTVLPLGWWGAPHTADVYCRVIGSVANFTPNLTANLTPPFRGILGLHANWIMPLTSRRHPVDSRYYVWFLFFFPPTVK